MVFIITFLDLNLKLIVNHTRHALPNSAAPSLWSNGAAGLVEKKLRPACHRARAAEKPRGAAGAVEICREEPLTAEEEL